MLIPPEMLLPQTVPPPEANVIPSPIVLLEISEVSMPEEYIPVKIVLLRTVAEHTEFDVWVIWML